MVTDAQPIEGPRLRVGLIVPAGNVQRWVLTSIQAIQAAGHADLVVVLRWPVPSGPASGIGGRTLLGAYRRVDQRVFGRTGDPTELADPGAVLAGVPSIELERDVTQESIAAQLAGRQLDVLLQFSERRPGLVDERLARHGLWSHRISSGDGTGLGDVLQRAVVTTATLDAGADQTLGWTASATDRISLSRGMRGHLAKVAQLAPNALRDLRIDGRLPQPAPTGLPSAPVASVGRPSAATLAGQLVRLGLGYLARLVGRTVAPDRWIVAVTARPSGSPLPDPGRDRLQALLPPAGRGWADPFLVRFEGQTLLFVEEWLDAERRGRIALVRLDQARQPTAPETVLAVDGHLSYPQVFRWQDAWYLLPEQAARGGLELYRAVSFPTSWMFDRTLIAQPPLADATIALIDGRWWLFAAAKAPGGTSADELVLYSADAPIGPWQPHPRNPVLSDIRSARPAGALVQRDGRWYRPSQDGSVSYGWALNLNRIDRLDDAGYRETRVAQLQPNWRSDVVGTHTLAEVDDLTAIDLSVRWPRLGRRFFRAD